MRQPDMRRIEKIEAQIGRDIRTDWIECRRHEMSQAEIAESWGVNVDTLRRWRKAFGFPALQQVYRLQPTGADCPNSLDSRARQLGYSSFVAYAYCRRYDGWTRAQMANELKCARGYIGMWFSRNRIDAPPPVRTEKQRAVSLATIEKARAARKFGKHIWREHESMRLR